MKVFIVSVGETVADVEGRYGGDFDVSLSNNGILQSHALAKRLMGVGVNSFFVSSNKSAVETALIFKKNFPFSLVSVGGLRERNLFGVMTGVKMSVAKIKFEEEVVELEANFPFHHVSGCEDYFVFAERVVGAFTRIVVGEYNKKTKVVAFVTHGGSISVIFREILGYEISGVKDCAFFELEYDGEGFEIISAQDVDKIESSLV